jgi:KDO2-lipid IV(A) lauroyltransferase
MAADQSPGRKYIDKAYWINFLGRDTAFLHGPEKHAVTNNYVVMYIDVQRKKRGYYTIELSVLTDKPSQLSDGEITSRFAKKLESIIYKDPTNWLWSHRRWKLIR